MLNGLDLFFRLSYNFRYLKGAKLTAYRENETKKILEYAVRKSRFYREYYKNYDLSNFSGLPYTDKNIFMNNFDILNTEGLKKNELIDFALSMEKEKNFLKYYKNKYVVGLSSGTSGNKGLTITKRNDAENISLAFLARSGIPFSLLPYRIIFILRIHNQAFENINSPFVKFVYVNQMEDPKIIIERANAISANIIMGPPSILRILAKLSYEFKVLPKMCVSYAEVLNDEDEQLIRKNLNCKLIQLYQTTEGYIASSCKFGKLHINEDMMNVELLRCEDNCKRYEIAVTNLYNYVHPIIRYKMNDIVEIGDKCECGSDFRVIEKIIGRSDDILYFRNKNDNKLKHIFPDFISRAVMNSSDSIEEYQVIEESPEKMIIRISVTEDSRFVEIACKAKSNVNAKIEEYGCIVPYIEVINGGILRNEVSSKMQRIRRNFKMNENDY